MAVATKKGEVNGGGGGGEKAKKKTEGAGASESSRYECESCGGHFCVDCDLFCHEVVHNCPGCLSRIADSGVDGGGGGGGGGEEMVVDGTAAGAASNGA